MCHIVIVVYVSSSPWGGAVRALQNGKQPLEKSPTQPNLGSNDQHICSLRVQESYPTYDDIQRHTDDTV